MKAEAGEGDECASSTRQLQGLGFSRIIRSFTTREMTMFSVFNAIKDLFTASADPAQDRDNQYLAESSDIHDLERRMRQVDSGRHNLYAIGAYGIFMR